jgi:DNA replication licensing factor MCM3
LRNLQTMQIDTSMNAQSEDIYKEQMRSKITDYMATRDVKQDITRMVGSSNNRLGVNLDKLRSFNGELANFVLQRPLDALSMFEQQLDHAVKDLKDGSDKAANEKTAARSNDMAFPTKVKKYYINFDGNFGRNHITPRGLKASLINQMVTV